MNKENLLKGYWISFGSMYDSQNISLYMETTERACEILSDLLDEGFELYDSNGVHSMNFHETEDGPTYTDRFPSGVKLTKIFEEIEIAELQRYRNVRV